MVNLSRLHRQDVLIMQLVKFHCSLYVTLFSLVSLFICTHIKEGDDILQHDDGKTQFYTSLKLKINVHQRLII